jgi:putative ABC transport system permease protein
LLGFVLAGMRQRALRTLTAVVTVAVTLAVLTLALAGLRKARLFTEQIPDYLAVGSNNVWSELPVSYASLLSRVPGVESVEYSRDSFAMDGTPNRKPMGYLSAASAGFFRLNAGAVIQVSPELEDRWRREQQGLISDAATAKRMGWRPDDPVSLTWRTLGGAERVTPFHFLGTFEGIQPGQLVAHYEYVDQLLPAEERGQVAFIGVFRSKGAVAQTDEGIGKLFRGLPEAVRSGPSAEWVGGEVASEMRTTSLLEKIVLAMLAITCAIVGTTISMSLRERRPEIATLRALGFRRARVFGMVLTESTLIALGGYALGAVIPTAALALRGKGLELSHGFLVDVRPGIPELLLAAVAAASLAFGICLWPAASAARQDVVLALQED